MVPPKRGFVNLMSELCAQLCAYLLFSARKAARGRRDDFVQTLRALRKKTAQVDLTKTKKIANVYIEIINNA